MIYEKVTVKTWDHIKDIPECPAKGAFEINYNDHIYFMLDGNLHRTDGPAVIWTNGTQRYLQNNELHRDDGPAVIWHDGTEYYYQKGELHREDGPAIIGPGGSESYYLFDKHYSKEIWETKVVQLRLKEQIL